MGNVTSKCLDGLPFELGKLLLKVGIVVGGSSTSSSNLARRFFEAPARMTRLLVMQDF
jgi:hypothetical protein